MSRKRLLTAVTLMIVGVLAGTMGAFVHTRAEETRERLDRSIAAAEQSLQDADMASGEDRRRHLERAESETRWADWEVDELHEQRQGALWLGVGAVPALAAGVAVLLLGRRAGSEDHTPA